MIETLNQNPLAPPDPPTESPKNDWKPAIVIAVIAVIVLGAIAINRLNNDDDSTTPATAPAAVEEDLTGVLTLDELVDVAVPTSTIFELCAAVDELQTAGVPDEAMFSVFADNFGDAGLEFGYTTREVYDELVSRC